jgi:hypothetical protein
MLTNLLYCIRNIYGVQIKRQRQGVAYVLLIGLQAQGRTQCLKTVDIAGQSVLLLASHHLFTRTS